MAKKLNILIVYAHPSLENSHNSLVMAKVKKVLEGKGMDYRLIDLYRDSFDPMVSKEEWSDHNKLAEKTAGYQKAVREADRLIFIYPIWWYTYPAILKGFFDKVFTSGFAYNFRKEPLWMSVIKRPFKWLISVRTLYPIYYHMMPVDQHLKGKKALVINTFGGDESGFRLYGHAPEFATDKAVLEFCGIRPVYRVNWYEARHKNQVMPPSMDAKISQGLEKLLKD